jgi:hypothetical protein
MIRRTLEEIVEHALINSAMVLETIVKRGDVAIQGLVRPMTVSIVTAIEHQLPPRRMKIPGEKSVTDWLQKNLRSYRHSPIDESERVLIADVLIAIRAMNER